MIDPHSSPWEAWLNKWFVPLLLPAILVNISGVFIRIIEPDGALYAMIARTMAETGDLINLRVEGKDWLDKPHFPFWAAAISFRILGISSFAYKLPALLFWAAGGWYTYRMAKDIYGKATAQLSVLIYVSAAHLVISNNDVRAEPYLTGMVIGAVYHFYKVSRSKSGLHLVAGSLLAACAIMTKGPFVLVTIGGGFILDWIIGKEWRQFRNVRWWIALLLIGLFITPELYCLYRQFDLHPEKRIFGRTGVSGIRFFFWDSQFGRFFNTGPIKGNGDLFFYFHTLLWAFLPWSLLLYAAVFRKIRDLGHRTITGDRIALGAAALSFAMFSLSRFQLPHYINILFPFFSILTAGWLYRIHRRITIRGVGITQGIITFLLPVLLLFLCWLYRFPGWPLVMIVILGLAILPFRLFRGNVLVSAVGRSYWMALLTFILINCCLYPAILGYQAGMAAGDYLRHQLPACGTIYMPEKAPDNYSIEFYSPCAVQRLPRDSFPAVLDRGPAVFFITKAYSDTLSRMGYRVERLRQFPNFHVSQLTGEFLDHRTRGTSVEWFELARVDIR
ncbi:MAG: glycosyltransferase family 39 protein [Chitinophagaceae bacterium]|nr:glycosyltransferase family 39 protein [Chitinophagaceae bacterium]